MTPVTRHLQITGRVQGVGYRYYMTRAAREMGIAGWVRNCTDGSVEAMVSGTPEAVEKIVAWARRGPTRAAVSEVLITEAGGAFSGFETLPTA